MTKDWPLIDYEKYEWDQLSERVVGLFFVLLNSNQTRMTYVDNNSTKARTNRTKDFSADNRI